MATTLTAVVVEQGMLHATHVGDCRLYVSRGNQITQISQDHTLIAEQVKRGLLTAEEAREHPERSILLRNLGHELIVSIAKISIPLIRDDRVIVCSDGLYNVLRDREIEQLSRGLEASAACRLLIDTANERGTNDNLTCAVFRMIADTPHQSRPFGQSDGVNGFEACSVSFMMAHCPDQVRVQPHRWRSRAAGRVFALRWRTTTMRELSVGERLDQYRLVEVLARSGMARFSRPPTKSRARPWS